LPFIYQKRHFGESLQRNIHFGADRNVVVPILQARDLVPREDAPEPLRQKIFHVKLPKRHPAAAYRRG
jgi:hypothetical protein